MASSGSKAPDLEERTSRDDLSLQQGSTEVKDGDAALTFLRRKLMTGEMSAIDEKKLVRKIDWMIIPLMWCCYCLQYLDKTLSMIHPIGLLPCKADCTNNPS